MDGHRFVRPLEDQPTAKIVDLSHVITDGMITYKGLPGPHICDYFTREYSADFYGDGERFVINRIDMVANTGTYLDVPFHRFEDGDDLAAVSIDRVAGLEGLCVRSPDRPADVDLFEELDVSGKAVLVDTGWDRLWGTEAYFEGAPFVTEAAAHLLAERGAALVGIDAPNIDDMSTRRRPVHTVLLGAGTLICEHLTQLAAVPDSGFRFFAAPPKIVGMGTFSVRAYVVIE